jgi:putative oxidoreductase
MIAHGVRHGRTLEGTARWFGSIGFRQPRLQAQASAAVEIGAGGALVLGAATPLAAAGVVGTLAVAARSVHVPNGFFITGEGYEYVLNIGTAVVALSALGSGRLSVDHLVWREERLSGAQRAALTAGLGLAGAAAHLAIFWRPPVPVASDEPTEPLPAEPAKAPTGPDESR